MVFSKYFSLCLQAIATCSVCVLAFPLASTANGTKIGTVKQLSLGDRACYVTLENESGMNSVELASFEICERDDIVGKKVQLTYTQEEVLA